MQRKPIVVTGLGVISSIGFGKEEFFDNLCIGKDGVSLISSISTEKFKRLYACEIKRPLDCLENSEEYSSALKMVLMATQEAVTDSGILDILERDKIAVSIGTTNGGALEFENWYCNNESYNISSMPKTILEQYSLHSIAKTISTNFNFAGLCNSTMTACASSATAIAIGCQWLQSGRADVVICGGVDVFKPTTHLLLSQLRVISPDYARPFDANRNGFLLGEGAGILVLENEEHARKRNAKIYAKVMGYGMSCDANDISNPDAKGLKLAVEKAIKMAGINYSDINLIKAQGTGAESSDGAEIKAMNELFGGCRDISMTSFKGAIGHTTGAAGGIESIALILSIIHKKIPPIVHTTTCDPKCEIDLVLRYQRKAEVKIGLANFFGFGGNNVSLVFGEV